MRVAFFSNFLNHHQLPFCKAMCELTNGEFTFVATEPIEKERLEMGYEDMNHLYDFVLCTYESDANENIAYKLAMECDIVITGSAPEKYTIERIKQNKITFRYSERIYKKGLWRALSPRGCRAIYRKHGKYKNNQLYMLCASAYTAADFAIQGAYINKTFKWGYFPEVKKYNIEDIINKKMSMKRDTLDGECVSILWAGRLIKWKHPEAAILLASKLKEKGYKFDLSIIGNGILEEKLKQLIVEKNLSNCVKLLGAMSPENVRSHMENADIFLFTSDFNEGWGAVLNEAMNSGCTVVASHAIGSVPFVIKDGYNGVVYKNGSQKNLNKVVMKLLDNPQERKRIGRNAYNTMIVQWNAEVAAKRLLKLAEELGAGNKFSYSEGPCSVAKRIFQWNMYKHCKGSNDELK